MINLGKLRCFILLRQQELTHNSDNDAGSSPTHTSPRSYRRHDSSTQPGRTLSHGTLHGTLHGPLHGMIPFYKPALIGSKDLSRKLGRWLVEHHLAAKKYPLGHVGTLDPLAEGVLPVLMGRATRLQDYLLNSCKIYNMVMEFGYETDTLDSTGTTVKSCDTPRLSGAQIHAVLKAREGSQSQVPPFYSAIKVRGRPLYSYARGAKKRLLVQQAHHHSQDPKPPIPLEQLSREIHIHSITVLRVSGDGGDDDDNDDSEPLSSELSRSKFSHSHSQDLITDPQHPDHHQCLPIRSLTIRVSCSKGTYMRSLCRDIGHDLGTLATMSSLVRRCSAQISSTQCYTLEEITQDPCRFHHYLIPMHQIPLSLPRIAITSEQKKRLFHGLPLFITPSQVRAHPTLPGILAAHQHDSEEDTQQRAVLITDLTEGTVISLGTRHRAHPRFNDDARSSLLCDSYSKGYGTAGQGLYITQRRSLL